jgi:hypothetical protein
MVTRSHVQSYTFLHIKDGKLDFTCGIQSCLRVGRNSFCWVAEPSLIFLPACFQSECPLGRSAELVRTRDSFPRVVWLCELISTNLLYRLIVWRSYMVYIYIPCLHPSEAGNKLSICRKSPRLFWENGNPHRRPRADNDILLLCLVQVKL